MVKNWALAIGINHYEFLQPLKYAERDAQLIQQFFRHEAGFERVLLFSDRSPDLAGTSTRPNRANLWQFLQQFFERPLLKPEDNFWFFFSGHGMVHNGHDYLMPCDANPEDIENTAISVRDLIERLHRCGSDNIILIFDACRYQNKKTGEGIGRQTQQIACKTGAIGIFACGPDEHSHEIDTLQKGVFTHALLEGLGNQGQCATIERLNQYLSFRVPQLVSQYKNTRQTPHIVAEPKTKLRLILLPKHATLDDIATLKISAFQAEDDRDLAAAEQLWMQVHAAVSIPDMDFIEAIQRIAQLRAEFPQSCTNLALQSASVRRNGGFCWPLPTTEVTNSNLCLEEISKIPENFLKVSDTTILPHYTYKIKDNYANLYSEQEIEYQRLQDLLATGNWREADRETLILMQKVANREKQGWLNIESINKFPCTDLYTIDRLWLQYSHGRFGLSMQKQIWDSVGGQPNADYETWCQFCDRLGWRVNNNWLFYSDLTFNINAPQGHFPAAGIIYNLTAWRGWVVGSFSCVVGFSALVSKMNACNI